MRPPVLCSLIGRLLAPVLDRFLGAVDAQDGPPRTTRPPRCPDCGLPWDVAEGRCHEAA